MDAQLRDGRTRCIACPGALRLFLFFALIWILPRAQALAEPPVVHLAGGQSIEQAIEAAPSGAVLRIPAGTFSANITLSKPLTLEGAGWEQTIIRAKKSITTATASDLQAFAAEIRSASDPKAVAEVRATWRAKLGAPTLTVSGTDNVVIRGIRFIAEAPPAHVEGLYSEPIVLFLASTNVLMTNCVITGPFWDGIHVSDASSAVIENTLIAGMWGTGVAIEGQQGEKSASHAVIRNSEIRNCYHRCVTIGAKSDNTVLADCRISGSAWHGIRYDAASPTIEGCVIYGNARSGIYASGETAAKVFGNLFWGNEMGGMSCWSGNQDVIERNTFASNKREGISVQGKSKPQLLRNIFYGHPAAILCGAVAGEKDVVIGSPALEHNLFWKNAENFDSGKVKNSLPGKGSLEVDPMFRNVFAKDFRLEPGSPALKEGIGATAIDSVSSQWPLTSEEEGIIPETDTRDSEAWRKPGKARPVVRQTPTRAKDDTRTLIDEAFRIDSKEARDAALAEIGCRVQAKDPATVLSGLQALGATCAVDFDRTPMRDP
ncbi:MAG TPA: right-handed parallel beta-helix repeat-containing protein, partial [Clostridia bacterium]|nr:right-handed parallel beta-helix repeat-containing protein [Clostridia bacterium]